MAIYRRILAAVNEHVNSEAAARYALEIARYTKGKIYFCSIAERSVPERLFRRAEEAVLRLFHRARELSVEAESIVESGDPLERISGIVRIEGIDLVFAATRREDTERRFFVRTTARRLALRLPCSIALVRVVHMGRLHPKEILVPLKARIPGLAEQARFVGVLAGAFGSRLYLFHAARPIRKLFHGEMHLTPIEWEKKLPRDISLFIEHLDRLDVEHERRLAPGREGRSIAIEAAARKVDLIVMGASTRGLVISLLKENPVEQVLRETPCDLIILRPRHENT